VTDPLIYLPGMMCDARLFGPQVAHLPGEVLPIWDHATIAALAADVLDRAPPSFALVGLSMGGIVAMEMLHQAPDRVARLALLDTNPLAEAEAMRVRRQPQIDRAEAGELAAVMRDEMKPNYLSDGPDKAAILDLCMDMALGLGPAVFRRQSLALRDRADRTEALRAYRGPALILCGRDDTLCPVARHELMHALMPQSDLRIIDGAGHLPTLEQPAATTAALHDWLHAP